MHYGFLVATANKSLFNSLMNMMDFAILLILLLCFIQSMNIGQEFQFKSFKYELISGLSRTGKYFSYLTSIVLQALLFTLILAFIGITYFSIVNNKLPQLNLALLSFFLTYFICIVIYGSLITCVSIWTKHGFTAIFLSFGYFVIENLLTGLNVLRLEPEVIEKLKPNLLLGSMGNLLGGNLFELKSASILVIPLVYLVVFNLLSLFRINRIQVQ